MATRSRNKWKPDSNGNYFRQIGWKLTDKGNILQHKFPLGSNLPEAKNRERRLKELWDEYARGEGILRPRLAPDSYSRPVWPTELLQIAKQVARGATKIAIARNPDETLYGYAGRIQRLQTRYPVICFAAVDQRALQRGQKALQKYKTIDTEKILNGMTFSVPSLAEDKAWRTASEVLEKVGVKLDRFGFSQLIPSTDDKVRASNGQSPGFQPANSAIKVNGSKEVTSIKSSEMTMIGESLHSALKTYKKKIGEDFYRDELGRLTDWGRTQERQIDTLMEHHEDRPLAELNYDVVDDLIAYWRRRPMRKGASQPVKAKSASNYISLLKRFFRWLHKSIIFDWRKPEDFDDINTKVTQLESDRAKGLQQVKTFSLEELVLLMRYGQPMDRFLLLMGLNCGFGNAEVASLLVNESHLRKAHEPRLQEILGYTTTDDDSFIKRIRRKNGVYGEFILFPQTVMGLEWALERRRVQDDFGTESRLLLNDNGRAFDTPTKSGNRNQQLTNYFTRLIKRIRKDNNEISDLSVGKLRKTAGDLIRRFSDGEVMAVFHCRGRAVQSDDLADIYSNRPFGKVFRAIRQVEEYLAPVFEAAGPNPFAPQPQAYTKRKTIRRIKELHDEGTSVQEIADVVGISGDTVRRQLARSSDC